MTTTQVRKIRANTSGRSICDRRTRYGWPSPVWDWSIAYRVPIPRAVSPSPIAAPAAMIAPHSARMLSPPEVGESRSLADHPEPAGTHEDDPGEDDEQAAAPAPGPRPVRPGRPHPAEEPTPAQAAAGAHGPSPLA